MSLGERVLNAEMLCGHRQPLGKLVVGAHPNSKESVDVL